jgi:hypothetical protein
MMGDASATGWLRLKPDTHLRLALLNQCQRGITVLIVASHFARTSAVMMTEVLQQACNGQQRVGNICKQD